MQLTFQGGRELARALRQLPRAIAKSVLVAAVLAGAAPIHRAAFARAPRDAAPRRRKGKRLADTIRTVVVEQLPSAVTVAVGTKDPRAHLNEYGHQQVPRGPTRRRVSVTRVSKSGRVTTRLEVDPTAQRKRRSGAATGFTPPKPFMRPAWDQHKEGALRKIAEVLATGIEAETKRLAMVPVSGRWVAGGGVAGVA